MKSLLSKNSFLFIPIFYIFLIPTMQAYLCTSLKIIGWYVLVGMGITIFAKSKKISFSFVEVLFIVIFLMLNIYYIYINQVGFIYLNYTYIFLLTLFFSKFINNLDINEISKKMSFLYGALIFLLLLEYIHILIFGNSIFVSYLVCNEPGVVGYRYISNYSVLSSFMSTPGMNSILLGPQTATQISLASLIWFFIVYKNLNNPFLYKTLICIALFILFFSPTLTISLMSIVLISIVGIYNAQKSLVRFSYISLSFILIGILVGYFLTMIYSRYGGFNVIINDLVIPQVFNMSFLSYKEIFLGVNLDKVSQQFLVTEIAMFHHLVIYGIIGVSLFLSFVGYYILESYQKLSNLDVNQRAFYLASLLIVILFLLSNLHYQVMFQVGVMEIFAIHMAYIVSLASRSNKMHTDH